MHPFRILVVFGTRPEAIKLCALVRRLQSNPQQFDTRVVVTAQHRSMLDQVLATFGVRPDYDLDLMTPRQTLGQLTGRVLSQLEPILQRERPQMVIVQGDTTTTFAAGLAAFYAGLPVAHIEAGLRSGQIDSPFPEEMNRVLTSRFARLHFAASDEAAANLCREGVPAERVRMTGNTGVDAVLYARDAFRDGRLPRPEWPFPKNGRRLILATAHRRESHGRGIEDVCRALAWLAERPDVDIVFPVHRNPNVRGPVARRLARFANVHLLDPLDYQPFVDLLMRCDFIITDSGGIQEEAPALGKPVLVLRENTERPEAVAAGVARLVGTDPLRIVREASQLLDDPVHYQQMARPLNLYGDGRAGERIAAALEEYAATEASGAKAFYAAAS
ncbi:MAG: UDP-N-acetylglucosamine 2-epimerase (non-hydrolyzing) [Bryobacterales bacterium]